MDIQKQEFDYIEKVEPNLFHKGNLDLDVLELYDGENVVRVTKLDIEIMHEYFLNQ